MRAITQTEVCRAPNLNPSLYSSAPRWICGACAVWGKTRFYGWGWSGGAMERSPPTICNAGMKPQGSLGDSQSHCPHPQLLMTTPSGGRAEQTIPGAQRGMLRPQWGFSLTATGQAHSSEDGDSGSASAVALRARVSSSLVGPLGGSRQMAHGKVPGSWQALSNHSCETKIKRKQTFKCPLPWYLGWEQEHGDC